MGVGVEYERDSKPFFRKGRREYLSIEFEYCVTHVSAIQKNNLLFTQVVETGDGMRYIRTKHSNAMVFAIFVCLKRKDDLLYISNSSLVHPSNACITACSLYTFH